MDFEMCHEWLIIHSLGDVTITFQTIFPNSAIAKSFSVARIKGTYFANHGMAPYFKSILMSEVKSSNIYVLPFD